MALARNAKDPVLRESIANAVKGGFKTAGPRTSASPQQHPPQSAFQRLASQRANTSELLYPLRKVTFEEVQLEADIQLGLDELVEELEYREGLAERGLRARNRFLFWGLPGNGKTLTASAFGNALGMRSYCVSIPDVVSCYIGSTGKNLAELFASIDAESLVVFDELDAIGSSRGGGDGGGSKEYNTIVTTLLTLLDRHKSGVIVGTTNRPDILDPALLRRFDEKMEFPAPNEGQKRALARKLCEKFQIDEVDVAACINFDEVTKCVETQARRIVMRELRAAEEREDEDHESN